MKTSSRIEWCNENEGRAYPILESATRVADDGAVLPNDVIADLGLVLPEFYTELRFSSIYVSQQIVSVVISCSAGVLLTGSYARAGLTPYAAYPLDVLADNCTGWIVFGNHRAAVPERYQFATAAQAGIEPRSIRTLPPPGVTKFLRKGSDPLTYASGLVKFEGDSSFDVTRDPDNAQNVIVRLKAAAQSKFTAPCSQEATADYCGVPPLRRIANIPADASGVIRLRFE